MQENNLELKQKLHQGLSMMGLMHEAQLELLWQYLLLLEKWNHTFNLTAVRDLDAMLTQHIFDSLAIYKYLQGDAFIDIGTGAGLPGIPLSIIAPEQHFTLLDSNSKKTAFLLQVQAALQLKNITVVNTRVTQHTGSYAGILSRAFSSLDDFIKDTQHLLQKGGRWYAMKGPHYTEELTKIPQAQIQIKALTVPFLNKERFLIIIENAEDI
jgi:16S rRNA (guanine527-N7)-methyltransferase